MSVVIMFKTLKVIDVFRRAHLDFNALKFWARCCSARCPAVAAIVMFAQVVAVPNFAQSQEKRTVPPSKSLSSVMKIVEQTSGIDTKTLTGMVGIMFRSSDPNNWQGPEQGTFYDRKGRLRKWVRDSSAPGGIRVLESPNWEALRKLTGGLIDWRFESDYVGSSLTDLPWKLSKPVLDQSYQERKNARMWFSTKMGLSLSLPSPMVIDKEYILRGTSAGGFRYPYTVRYWVDGEEKDLKEGNASGHGFTLPVKFATSGIHSLKVETFDADGKKVTRFISFPVAFKFTTESKKNSRDGDHTLIRIKIKGSDGPFKATFVTNDGQKIEKSIGYNDSFNQRIPNPGMDTVKWIDVVLEDTKAGYVVINRIELDDEPVVASLTADRTELAPDENVTLSVDVKGGKSPFYLYLYVDGKNRGSRIAEDRKGTFSINFDDPGTYSVYVDVVSKNLAKEKISTPSQTITLIVAEPEVEDAQGSYYGWLTLGGSAASEYQYSFKHSTFSFTIEDKKVSGKTSGVLYSPLSGGTTDSFRGVISGTYDPETKKISAS